MGKIYRLEYEFLFVCTVDNCGKLGGNREKPRKCKGVFHQNSVFYENSATFSTKNGIQTV